MRARSAILVCCACWSCGDKSAAPSARVELPPPVRVGVEIGFGCADWCFVHPFPTATRIATVWGTERVVRFGGDLGTLIKFEDDRWSGEAGHRSESISAIVGASPVDFWILRGGVPLHSTDGGVSFTAHGMGRSFDRLQLAGTNLLAGAAGETFRWTGTAWVSLSGPFGNARLIAAAPWGGVFGATDGYHVLRDGAWSKLDYKSVQLGAESGGEVYLAVGVPPSVDAEIVRGDGKTWTTLGTVRGAQAITKAADLFVVSNDGLQRWDGVGSFVTVAAPFPASQIASAGTDLWLFSESRLARLRGDVWARPPNNALPDSGLPPPMDTSRPTAIWSSAPDDVWLVGPGVLRHDGKAFRLHATPPDGVVYNTISGTSADDVWVGGSVLPYPNTHGFLSHWDGKNWQHHDLPAIKGVVLSLGSARKDDVWAVAGPLSELAIFRWNGTTWAPQAYPSIPVGASAPNVFVRGPDDVFIAGASKLLHWNGTSFSVVSTASPTSEAFELPLSVWGAPGGPLYASVRRGSHYILRDDGSGFTPLWRGSGEGVSGILGDGPDLWAASSAGMLHHDGVRWTRVNLLQLNAQLWATRPSDLWLVGGGMVLRRTPR